MAKTLFLDIVAVLNAHGLASTDIPANHLIMPWKGVKFDETGQNVESSGILVQIIDGKYHTVWPFALASRDIVWPMPAWGKR